MVDNAETAIQSVKSPVITQLPQTEKQIQKQIG